MTTAEAQRALEEGRQRHLAAQQALADARGRVADLEGRITAAEDVSPSALADAKAAAEHAALVAQGTEAPLAALHDAAARAFAEDEVDRIASTTRLLEQGVAQALAVVEEALRDFAVACAKFDTFVKAERSRAGTRCRPSSRFRQQPNQQPVVDGVPLTDVRPISQVAQILVPMAADLGVQQFLRDDLKTLAAAARPLPEAR